MKLLLIKNDYHLRDQRLHGMVTSIIVTRVSFLRILKGIYYIKGDDFVYS